MTYFETITTTAAALVPTGKSLVWIVGVAVSMFLAGVGFTVSAGEYAELPDHVAILRGMVDRNSSEIVGLRGSIETAARDGRRMLCLLELQVDAQASGPLSPLEYNRRINTCESPAGGGGR